MDLNKTNYQEQKQELEKNGFQGFVTISDLTKNPALAPSEKGVYMILRESENAPEFLKEGTGGFYKGKNPNVTIPKLKQNYISNSHILYIGQTTTSLYERLNLYMCFGNGESVMHYGGRYIWQLKDAQKLIVCWKKLKNGNPENEEYYLIEEFKKQHNKLPFANCKSGNTPKKD